MQYYPPKVEQFQWKDDFHNGEEPGEDEKECRPQGNEELTLQDNADTKIIALRVRPL